MRGLMHVGPAGSITLSICLACLSLLLIVHVLHVKDDQLLWSEMKMILLPSSVMVRLKMLLRGVRAGQDP